MTVKKVPEVNFRCSVEIFLFPPLDKLFEVMVWASRNDFFLEGIQIIQKILSAALLEWINELQFVITVSQREQCDEIFGRALIMIPAAKN